MWGGIVKQPSHWDWAPAAAPFTWTQLGIHFNSHLISVVGVEGTLDFFVNVITRVVGTLLMDVIYRAANIQPRRLQDYQMPFVWSCQWTPHVDLWVQILENIFGNELIDSQTGNEQRAALTLAAVSHQLWGVCLNAYHEVTTWCKVNYSIKRQRWGKAKKNNYNQDDCIWS